LLSRRVKVSGNRSLCSNKPSKILTTYFGKKPGARLTSEIVVEICVDSVNSAIAAERGGAQRIELCSDLLEGGITPSAGLIELVRAKVSIGLQVMIRPRGGDFCYDDDEFEIMQRDIGLAKKLGADGVVFGMIDADGRPDKTRCQKLVNLARPMDVTFHRAFDMSADLKRSLDDVCAVGADRILTSGGQPTALQGLETISALVKAAKGRIAIMPGSGIKSENARRIVEESGVREIHAGLGSVVPGPMRFRNSQLVMGKVAEREYQRVIVLEESVRSLCRAVSPRG
jgi:copper homeostasis protein